MLASKLSSRASLILRGCSHHTPAASVALSRILASSGKHKAASTYFSTVTKCNNYAVLTEYDTSRSQSLVKQPSLVRQQQWFATQPIICSHDDAFANDLTSEEFDKAYMYLYEQHNHPRGPWVKVLQWAQNVLAGHKKTPRILVLASGPGEPAATLATNFQNAEVVSVHSTSKCFDWAKDKFHKLGLSNVTPKLTDMQSLDHFSDGSFDLVVVGYGLAHSTDPQSTLNEVHRVLKPGGSLLSYVWEQLPADPGSDIILRHACVGPNPWHQTDDGIDAVGNFRCPVRTKKAMSLSKPHLLEGMIECANLSLVQVTRDEYALKLGNTKEQAFKAISLPIRSELQELKAANHYHASDAAEAFEDVLNEGFMVKNTNDGGMEVPYNVYKYVVARREFEDGDKDTKVSALGLGSSSVKFPAVKSIDVRQDPVAFDTWVRMKLAASDKLIQVVNKELKSFCGRDGVMILDSAPSMYGEVALALASSNPNASVVATSRSKVVVDSIGELARGVNNISVKELDPSHLSSFDDKTFDVVICSFGLAFLQSPEKALSELRRVLKPGGSVFITIWEDLSLSQLTRYIVNEMGAAGSMQDFAVFDSLQPYSKPRELEQLVTASGFNVNRVDHETARILLSDSKNLDFGLNVATLPIRSLLQELEKTSGLKARDAFNRLLKDPSLVSHDEHGNATTTLPSRFKLISATRPHEDSDGYLTSDKTRTCTSKKTFKVNDIPK